MMQCLGLRLRRVRGMASVPFSRGLSLDLAQLGTCGTVTRGACLAVLVGRSPLGWHGQFTGWGAQDFCQASRSLAESSIGWESSSKEDNKMRTPNLCVIEPLSISARDDDLSVISWGTEIWRTYDVVLGSGWKFYI